MTKHMTASSGRRLGARLAIALFSTGWITALAGVPAQAADNPILISARVGYSDVIKSQQWMPVSIAITNNGADVIGTLEIQGTSSFGKGAPAAPAIYSVPVAIAGGTSKRVRTYLMGDASTATVRIVKDGRILATANAASSRTTNTLVGVLSDNGTALDDAAAVRPGRPSVDVVHLHLEDIPDSALALRAFDLLVIDGFATDSLSQTQQTAISDYVRTGGALLIGTGASWRRALAGLPADLLPMKLDAVTTLGASTALSGLAGVQIATGSLTSGTAWLSESGQPLLAERSVGSGSVTLATFDWIQDPMPDWAGTKVLLRQVLARALYGGTEPATLPNQFGGPGGNSTFQRSSQLSRALGNLPALELPSLVLTCGLVLGYVLLVGPVNFFLLRALRRRALAWVTLPVIAALVAAGAYGGALMVKGRSVQTNQLSIIHLDPESDRAYQETYTGVITPTRGDYQVGLGRRGLLVSPISTFNFSGPTGGDIRVDADTGQVGLPGMSAFTMRGFATERIMTAPHLAGHLQEVNGRLTGEIENLSSTDFSDSLVIVGDGYQKLGRLKPGATISVDVAPAAVTMGGPPAIFRIYPNYSYGVQPSESASALRSGETKTEILSLLHGGPYPGGPAAGSRPMVVAWTDQSFQDVTVNGGRPGAHAETAVVMSLPVDQIGKGTLPAGVVGGRIIDLEGATAPGPPGAVMLGNGTVTYEFTPQLAPGLHFAGQPSISAANQFMGKPIGPGGPQPALRGEAWDWTSQSWVEIPFQSNGSTTLPAATVNPAGGEVRLRVTVTNSTFMVNSLSLMGDVE